jgi:hypothetical protein
MVFFKQMVIFSVLETSDGGFFCIFSVLTKCKAFQLPELIGYTAISLVVGDYDL